MLRVKFLINNDVDVDIDVEKSEFINNFEKHFDLSDKISINEWIDESNYQLFISFIDNQDYLDEWVASDFLELLEELRGYIKLVRKVDDEWKVYLITQLGYELYDIDENMVNDYVVIDSDWKLLDFIKEYYDKGLNATLDYVYNNSNNFFNACFDNKRYINDLIETTDFIDYIEYSYLINTANINETIEYKEPNIFYSEYEIYTLSDDVPKEIDDILIKTFDFPWRSEFNLDYGKIGRELILYPNVKDEEDYKKAILEEFGVPERLWGYFGEFRINNSNKIYTDYGLIAIKE